MRRKVSLLAVGLLTMAALSVASAADTDSSLALKLTGFEPLAAGHYEGWAIFGSEKVTTGKFALDDDGSLRTLGGASVEAFTVARDLAAADMIVVTIEPDGDIDEVPSGIVVLAGAVAGNSAALSFPVDLSSIQGGYILATPTDDDDANDVSGVWFLDPAGPSAALTLPALPDGWVYEGWGVTQGTPLSSGRFAVAEGADAAAPYSGPNAGPPFPGEDFVANLPAMILAPVDLADGSSLIVISVEPDLGGMDPTGDGPFSIKPLVAEVPGGLADHTLTALARNLGTAPAGTATLTTLQEVMAPATGDAGLAARDGAAIAMALLLVASIGVLITARALTGRQPD